MRGLLSQNRDHPQGLWETRENRPSLEMGSQCFTIGHDNDILIHRGNDTFRQQWLAAKKMLP